MADPQHPAVPFEQAVDLLTGEPRQLRPQHPDIAALIDPRRLRNVAILVRQIREFAVLPHEREVADTLDAMLRTLARPVEDEEVGPLLTRAKIELAWDDPAVRSAVRIPGEMTPDEKPFPKWLAGKMCDALARLAREKASAEQEIDAAWKEFGPAANRDTLSLAEQVAVFTIECGDDIARAEQEAARLRERRGSLFDAIAHGDTDHRMWLLAAIEAHFAGKPVPSERALAAAAGAEEPR